ncbi:MAG TPA: hypothetical protein VIJ63_15455, partial [Roseiarcus sp.]
KLSLIFLICIVGTNPFGGGLPHMAKRASLAVIGHAMSPILPISFVATLLCVLVAIDWAWYQQVLFVGAALSATVWVCSLEAWSCQEAPAKTEDDRGHYYPAE